MLCKGLLRYSERFGPGRDCASMTYAHARDTIDPQSLYPRYQYLYPQEVPEYRLDEQTHETDTR